MRTVLQRVTFARVRVDDETVGEIGPGLVALVGVTHEDGPDEVATTVRKIAELRIMAGELSVTDSGGAVLVVSQFTLHADVRKGRRPSWNAAAPGDVAEPVVEAVAAGPSADHKPARSAAHKRCRRLKTLSSRRPESRSY